jgi:sulfatase modifying factor 1
MPDLPFDLTDQTIKELAIDDAVARQNVAWFADRYGAQAGAYRLLACYAAMPLVLTPELLNYLHNRFLANAGLPWVAEVDLLLSELVHPVGEELYAMPPATRAYLLEELRRRVGDAELANVARVLLHYTRRLARTNPALDDEELRAQQWAAMVYLDELRPTAVREVAETFRALAEQLTARPASAPIDMQRAEFARLAHITQMLEPQIQAYPELVEYAAMVSRLLAGEEIGAAAVSVQVEEVTLRVPTQLRPLPLSTTTHAFVDVDVRVALAPDGLYTIDISVLGETSTCSQTPDLRPFQPLMERWRQGGSDALSVLEGQTLGRQLYDFLFARDELALFPRTKAGAVGLYGARTRLCLQLGPPELAALPWELLYDGSDFLGQAVDMALLRTLSLHKAASPQLSAPLRLLAVTPITFDWVEIPAGPFLLGSDKKKDDQAFDDELPQQSVTLPAYRIARTPVTVAQFAAFVQATGYQTDAEKRGSAYVWTGSKYDDVKGANWQHPRGPKSDVRQKQDHPVTCVTWQDAVAFCVWASEVTGTTIRLPSEAEWEKAARGTDGRIYPWGNDKPTKEHCNFNMDVGDTTPVGRYPKGASPYGLLDVAGNVWEWTNSLWIAYPYDPADGREDSYSEGSRTVRGGSVYLIARNVRCACRDSNVIPDDDVGLRVSSPGF